MPINQDTLTRYTGGVNFPAGTEEGFRVYVDSNRNLRYVRGAGTTPQRPDSPPLGHPYYDTDLAALLTWNGSDWDTSAGGAVESFNGRTGAVVPQAGDYAITDIDGLELVLGAITTRDLDAKNTTQTAMGILRPDGSGGLEWIRTHGTFAQRPSSPVAGQDYYDTGLKTWIIWDGSQWRQVVDSYPVTKSLVSLVGSTSDLDLTFDSAPSKGAGNFYFHKTSDDSLLAAIDVDAGAVAISTNTVTITQATGAGEYYVLADPGVIVGWCGAWHKTQVAWDNGA
jgi:hypothetical protein